ncbi:MAG: undecaprenyl-diphosphate phosphatase [Eubacteriales bacterium]
MSVIKAIIYGLIQGLCEFLPVSSSGHLAIAQNIFGMDNLESMITFDVILHLGTLLAVFIVYFQDILKLFFSFASLVKRLFNRTFKWSAFSADERFCAGIILATIPLVLIVPFTDKVEGLYKITKAVGALLILNGVVLLLSDKLSVKKTVDNTITPVKALIIGVFQLFAVVPGISRSGSTITGGLLNGFDRTNAVKFSFILSIPAILGANILSIGDIISTPIPQSDVLAYIAGALTAAVAGFAAIKLLMYITKKHTFTPFAIYCWVAGLLALILG